MPQICNPLSPDSLNWCEGETVLPGLRPKVFFTTKKSIVKFPTLPSTKAEGESMAKLSTYVGNFLLVAGAKWKSMDILVDRSPASSETQGSKPSKTFLNKATMVVANTNEDAAGFSRIANNGDFVYLIQQKNGKYRVIGNEMYQTETSPGLNLGSEASGTDIGMSIEIQCTDICHMPFYEGEIITEDGTINETPVIP